MLAHFSSFSIELLAYPARDVLLALQVNNSLVERPHFAQLYMFRFNETVQFYYMFEKYPQNRATTFLPKTCKNMYKHVKTAQKM